MSPEWRIRHDKHYRRMWGSVATCLERTCYFGLVPAVLSLGPMWVQEAAPGTPGEIAWAVWGILSVACVDFWATFIVTGCMSEWELRDE